MYLVIASFKRMLFLLLTDQLLLFTLLVLFNVISMGIESVVNENIQKASDGLHDAMCSSCEMAVVWMQNQLKQNQTKEHILNYINEVN